MNTCPKCKSRFVESIGSYTAFECGAWLLCDRFLKTHKCDLTAAQSEIKRLLALVEAAYREGWSDHQSLHLNKSACWARSDAKAALEEVKP